MATYKPKNTRGSQMLGERTVLGQILPCDFSGSLALADTVVWDFWPPEL